MTAAGALAGWAALRLLAGARHYEFSGKTVLITGGSRGLGLVLAKHLAAEGARVAICGRDQEALERARSALEAIGAEVFSLPVDVADREAVATMVQQVVGRFGPIDVLVNNAGVIQVGPAETMTLRDYEEA